MLHGQYLGFRPFGTLSGGSTTSQIDYGTHAFQEELTTAKPAALARADRFLYQLDGEARNGAHAHLLVNEIAPFPSLGSLDEATGSILTSEQFPGPIRDKLTILPNGKRILYTELTNTDPAGGKLWRSDGSNQIFAPVRAAAFEEFEPERRIVGANGALWSFTPYIVGGRTNLAIWKSNDEGTTWTRASTSPMDQSSQGAFDVGFTSTGALVVLYRDHLLDGVRMVTASSAMGPYPAATSHVLPTGKRPNDAHGKFFPTSDGGLELATSLAQQKIGGYDYFLYLVKFAADGTFESTRIVDVPPYVLAQSGARLADGSYVFMVYDPTNPVDPLLSTLELTPDLSTKTTTEIGRGYRQPERSHMEVLSDGRLAFALK